MALATLTQLDKHKSAPFPPGYPEAARTFYSPVDDIHGALTDLLQSAGKSLVIAMYGYDDAQLNQVIMNALNNEQVYVQMSLDRSQAAGATEKAILAQWRNDVAGKSIAIGTSEKGAIMHLKLAIIDGLDVVTGSTNWSTGGETRQDNQLTVIRDPLVAAEARARLDIIHDTMLKQMAASGAQPAPAAAQVTGRAAHPARRTR